MHPFVLYLAATDVERNHEAAGRDRRSQYTRVDALPLVESAPASRLGRLAATFGRRVARREGLTPKPAP